MRKITLITAIFFCFSIFAQHKQHPQSEKERLEQLNRTKKEIRAYVSKNLSAYKLNDEKTKEVKAFYQGKTTNDSIGQILKNAKKAELQKLYFKQHPETKDFLNSFVPPAYVYREVPTSLPEPESFNKSGETLCCESSIAPPVTINGVAITESYTGNVRTQASTYTSCGNVTTPPNSKVLGENGAFTYTMHFNPPVNNLIIALTLVNDEETFTFTTSAGNPVITTATSCFTSVSGNVITCSGSTGNPPTGGGGMFRITAPNSFSSLTISGPGSPDQNGHGGSNMSICSNSISTCASVIAPALTTTIITNDCPATTVNLNTITATNTPAGLTMSWHTGTPAATCNKLTTTEAAAQAPDNHYYAAFYDNTGACYGNTTMVTALLSECDACDGCCPNHHTVTETVTNNMVHKRQAKQTLTAKNTINSGGIGLYHADMVILKPPFVAVAGSKLRAYSEGCSNVYQEKTTDSDIEDAVTDFDKIALDKIDIKNNPIVILPNPNNGIFKVDLSGKPEGKITLTDLRGEIIYTAAFKNEKEFEINIHEKPKGIYILHIKSGENTFTSKIIKN